MSFQTPTYPGINLDANKGPILIAVGIAFSVTTGVTVILRFVARKTTRIDIERDDWLIVAASVFALAYNAVIIVEAEHNYYGQHIGNSNPYHLRQFLIGLYCLAVLYPIALTLTKLSLLALYWRIFRNSSVKRPIQIAAVLNICWMIAAVLVGLFSCNPVKGFWDVNVPSSCIQEYDFFLTNECLTIAMDLFVLLIPLWSIAQIQRSLSQRISIGSTFALGLCATAVSAVRLWQLVLAQQHPGYDPTFDEAPAGIWAVVEINTWIIVATIPALRPSIYRLYKRAREGSDTMKKSLLKNTRWSSQTS